jgi:hypothetical protein
MSFDPWSWPVIRDDPAYIIYQAPKGTKNVAILRDRCFQCGSDDQIEATEEETTQGRNGGIKTYVTALCHNCRMGR